MTATVEPWPILKMQPAGKTSIRMFTMLHVKNPACPDAPHSARLTGCGCLFTRNKEEAEAHAKNPPKQGEPSTT